MNANNDVTLTVKATEKKAGERVFIKFKDTYDGLVINSLFAVVGQVSDVFPVPEMKGQTFLGWRVAGTDNEPVMITPGETVFHLYALHASFDDTIILEPVFGNGISESPVNRTTVTPQQPTTVSAPSDI